MDERRPSLRERLSRLEAELDELIRLQESTKELPLEHVNVPSALQHGQQCRAISVTTRSRAMFSSHRQCCTHDPAASAPLADISRFLQHINLNISKGTQAIAKLATTTSQDTGERGENKKSCNNHYPHDGPNVWKYPAEKKNNEDSLFKQLREEKDGRMRAENQVKCLKDELKKTKCELQQKAESTINLLQEELKDTSEKLKQAECEIKRRFDEYKSAEYLWPLKYEAMRKELQDEKQKRKEADETVHKLQDTLQKLFLDTEEYLTLQKTASWIKSQNENLLCLVKKLRREIEAKDAEISGKTRCIEENLRKNKQLTGLCGKLRDFLIVTREKMATSESKLKLTMEHSQRLSDRMLQAQRQIEDLQRCRVENKNENSRLSELLRCSETKNNLLHSRLEEISEMMKKQNELITRQSDTIDIKDEQLKLAYENIKLQSQRLEDLNNTVSHFEKGQDSKFNSCLHAELSRLQSDLEKEKENAMIKDKIIDSHLKTFSEKKTDIMRKESDINKLKRDLSESERKLSIEKTTNEELLIKIKQLQIRKEELKRRVEDLEEESLQSSEHTTKLEQIEQQVQLKQKEWEELKAKLIKEKDEILEALRCSTQKLVDKTADYEMELENRQRVIDSFRLQVQEKDNQIKEGKCEISRLTKQLQEAEERSIKMKKRFEESLQSACEVWQKTMQQLNI